MRRMSVSVVLWLNPKMPMQRLSRCRPYWLELNWVEIEIWFLSWFCTFWYDWHSIDFGMVWRYFRIFATIFTHALIECWHFLIFCPPRNVLCIDFVYYWECVKKLTMIDLIAYAWVWVPVRIVVGFDVSLTTERVMMHYWWTIPSARRSTFAKVKNKSNEKKPNQMVKISWNRLWFCFYLDRVRLRLEDGGGGIGGVRGLILCICRSEWFKSQ